VPAGAAEAASIGATGPARWATSEEVADKAGHTDPPTDPPTDATKPRTGRLLASRPGQVLVAGTGLAVGVVGTLIVTTLIGPAGADNTAAPHTSDSRPASPSPVVVPPHLTLVQLSDRAVAAIDPPSTGRYAYLRQQSWLPDSHSPDMTDPYTTSDEQLWWAEDNNSGQRITTPDPKSGPPIVQDFVPGDLTSPVEAPSDDPVILAGQLSAAVDRTHSPVAIVRGVAEIYRYRVLKPAQRAAILRVLADTAGLKNEGPQRDRKDRFGIAISVTSDNGATRDVLSFDPDTGFLLSYERDSMPAAQAKTQSPSVTILRLYLDHSYTDHLGQPT
jgi:hypothetical protein